MKIPADVLTYRNRNRHYTGDLGPWLEHLVEDEGMSLGQAREVLASWEKLPYIDPEHGHMATLLKNKKEVHFAAYRRFRKHGHINTARLTGFLQPILDKEVFLVTKLAPDEPSAFIEHLGFQQLGVSMDGYRTFILNAIKYPEAKPCKQ